MSRYRPTSLAIHLSAAIALPMLLCPSAFAELAVEDLWVRAMPPGQTVTAGYGRLSNNGGVPLEISGVTTQFSASGEIHTTEKQGDVVRMRRIDPLTLAPGDSLLLEPGGPHLMLMGISTMPAADSTVAVCVQSSVGETCTEAPVLRKGPQPQHDHGHAHH